MTSRIKDSYDKNSLTWHKKKCDMGNKLKVILFSDFSGQHWCDSDLNQFRVVVVVVAAAVVVLRD